MTDSNAPHAKRLAGRSPTYPFFDLERSLARAATLIEKERVHATPVMTALKHWGYTNASGKAGLTLSALKQFGLLEDSGRGDTRKVQATTLAYDILNTPHEDERAVLLKQAALLPELHQEMWEEYGNTLPSDDALAWKLTKERGFTKQGAEDFIRQWKRTIEYALSGAGPGSLYKESSDSGGHASADAPSLSARGPSLSRVERADTERGAVHDTSGRWRVTGRASVVAAGQQFPIPLPGGSGTITIAGEFPMRETDWAYFMAVLTAMKPGLVAGFDPDSSALDED